MTVPMYIAESAPPDLRGQLVTFNNVFITGGQFAAGVVDGIFSYDKTNGWRYCQPLFLALWCCWSYCVSLFQMADEDQNVWNELYCHLLSRSNTKYRLFFCQSHCWNLWIFSWATVSKQRPNLTMLSSARKKSVKSCLMTFLV